MLRCVKYIRIVGSTTIGYTCRGELDSKLCYIIHRGIHVTQTKATDMAGVIWCASGCDCFLVL